MNPTGRTNIDGLGPCDFKPTVLIEGGEEEGGEDYDRILSKIVQREIEEYGGEARHVAKQGLLRLAHKAFLTLDDKSIFFKAIGLGRQKG